MFRNLFLGLKGFIKQTHIQEVLKNGRLRDNIRITFTFIIRDLNLVLINT